MLSKQSKQVIIKQLENDLMRYKDAHKCYIDQKFMEKASRVAKQILSLEKALKELKDV